MTSPATSNAADSRPDDMPELAAHISAAGGITRAGTHYERPTHQPQKSLFHLSPPIYWFSSF
jgi:hypothetical protein